MSNRKRLSGTSGTGLYTSFEKSKINYCVYCGEIATTREHIPSKAFLKDNNKSPDYLMTLPACLKCNNGFPSDEKYVIDILDKIKKNTENKAEELINIDNKRFENIIFKLALGHAAYEFDYIHTGHKNYSMDYNFIFNLTNQQIDKFISLPEIGSRSCFIVETNAKTLSYQNWETINNYKYSAIRDADKLIIKIILSNILFCEVMFFD